MTDVLGSAGQGFEVWGKNFDVRLTEFEGYYSRTRYQQFLKGVAVLKNHNIKSVTDIGTGMGHFVYLCEKAEITGVGLDIVVPDNINDKFLADFGKKCIFYGNFNEINTLLKFKSECTTNFHLTHIFEPPALVHLLKIFSNMSKFSLIHLRQKMVDFIKQIPFVKVLDVINMHDNDVMVFIEFTQAREISEKYKFGRAQQQILLVPK